MQINQDGSKTAAIQSRFQDKTKKNVSNPEVTGILLLMLEDDSMDVRLACINAISHFAKRFPSIRKRCLNFIIDMLNDEIDEVRIGSLHAIQRFSSEILTLDDYEVDIVLFNLNEDNIRLREEIYKFFGEISISEEKLMFKLLEKLWKNLTKFGDEAQILELLSKVGRSHAHMIAKLHHKILGFDKRFLVKEYNWNDMVYVGKMVLVLNAAMTQPYILKDAPHFFPKHITYLLDKYSIYLVGVQQVVEQIEIKQTDHEQNILKMNVYDKLTQ